VNGSKVWKKWRTTETGYIYKKKQGLFPSSSKIQPPAVFYLSFDSDRSIKNPSVLHHEHT
jgi:hypothetical protein